jgi:peptide/nickel transport system substrate-binding protein
MNFKELISRFFDYIRLKFTAKEMIFISVSLSLSLIGLLFYTKTVLANKFFVERIIYDGKVTEGIIGEISNLNPLSPETQLDKDISKLIFAGLVKNINGKAELDLASKIDMSGDGLSYTIYINPKATFHNDSAVEAKDVINSIKNLKNQIDFESVEITEMDSKTINLKLKTAFPEFISKLDFAIIPINYNPVFSENTVGSGLFRVDSIVKDTAGLINTINLIRFENKVPQITYLDGYAIKLYTDKSALEKDFISGKINITSGLRNQKIADINKSQKNKVSTSTMSTRFVLFINQANNENLKDLNFRKFISESIDRNKLVKDVFGDYASPIYNLSGKSSEVQTKLSPEDFKKSGFIFENSVLYSSTEEIKKEGDKKSEKKLNKKEVSLNLVTINIEEMLESAKSIIGDLQSKGIKVNLKVIEKEEIPNILKDKNFDLFLFGVNINTNYYSFFHSSQISYPKLNISSFANKKVDNVLEEIKSNKSGSDIESLKENLSLEIEKEMPIIFIYKPKFAIISNKSNINSPLEGIIYSSEDRYNNIVNWYTESEKTLKYFYNSNLIRKIETLF